MNEIYDDLIRKFKDFCYDNGGSVTDIKVPTNAKQPTNRYISCKFTDTVDITISASLLDDLSKELYITLYTKPDEMFYNEENEISNKIELPSELSLEINTHNDNKEEVIYESNVPFKPIYTSKVSINKKGIEEILLEILPKNNKISLYLS